MVVKCGEAQRPTLMEYLAKEGVYHAFLMADIENYGFDKEFQTVYGDWNGENLCGVYLRFYENLILSADKRGVNREFLRQLFQRWQPEVVMGKLETAEQVSALLSSYQKGVKTLYSIDGERFKGRKRITLSDHVILKRGKPGDGDKIHHFLMEIPEIRALYTSKKMIEDRLINGDGVHIFLEKEGRVIAHANSTALSSSSAMIGGVACAPEYRGRGYASFLTAVLVEELLSSGRTAGLFCDREEKENLFVHMGFEKTGLWQTLTRPKTGTKAGKSRRPSYLPVYNRLYHDIKSGVYQKGSLLPGENVLAAAYEVSRNTLRQALTILCQDGYIYKRQGKGTYVSYDCQKKEEKGICNFLRTCTKEPVRRMEMDYNVGEPTDIAREKLQLADGELVMASNNVYYGEKEPIGQSFLQIPIRVLKEEGLKEPVKEDQLKIWMDQKIYEKAMAAHLAIQVIKADQQVIPYMKIQEGTVLLYMEQVLYGADDTPIARIKYYFLPDKYQINCRLRS